MAIGRTRLGTSAVVARPATTGRVGVFVEPAPAPAPAPEYRTPARGHRVRAIGRRPGPDRRGWCGAAGVGSGRAPVGLRRGVHRDGRPEAAGQPVGVPAGAGLSPSPRLPAPRTPGSSRSRRAPVPIAVGRLLGRGVGPLRLVDAEPWRRRNRGDRPARVERVRARARPRSAHVRRPRDHRCRRRGTRRFVAAPAAVVARPTIGALALVGLLTHVSMFLLGAGLLVLAGWRTDREAWHWRMALAAALLGWAVLWGPAFLVQSGSGHSNWIPPTSPSVIVDTFGGLAVPQPTLHFAALVAIAAGAVLLWRSDRWLGRVFGCCVLVPAVLGALIGLMAPVMLDRTFTLLSWAPCLALGYLVAGLSRWSRLCGALAIGVLALVMIPAAVTTVAAPSSVDRALRHVEHVARAGDVVASHPGGRLHLLLWSIGVRKEASSYQHVSLIGLGNAQGVVLGHGPPSGRTWLLESVGSRQRRRETRAAPRPGRTDRSTWSACQASSRTRHTGDDGPRAPSSSPTPCACVSRLSRLALLSRVLHRDRALDDLDRAPAGRERIVAGRARCRRGHRAIGRVAGRVPRRTARPPSGHSRPRGSRSAR